MANPSHVSALLHDGPQQLLVSIGMRLELLRRDAPDELEPQLQELARQVALASDELHALTRMLDQSEDDDGSSRQNTDPDGSPAR